MNASHFKIILRELSTRDDGKQSIYLYCLINGTKKYYSLKYIIDPLQFDPVNQHVTKKCPKNVEINAKIDSYITKAKDLVNIADAHKTKASLVELDELLRSGQYDRQSFTDYIENDIKQYQKQFRNNTNRKYKSALNILKGFKNNIYFNEVNPSFWRKYELHLKGRGNNQTSVQKAFAVLNTFLNRAVAANIIKINPLIGVKVSKGESRMMFLTLKELDQLAAYYKTNLSKPHEKALRCFLFSCYTGTRFIDMHNMKYMNIVDGTHLVYKMIKVNKTITLPLNDDALGMLPQCDNTLPNMKIFSIFSNQPMNRYLKEIADLAKIDKKISYHYSRHTFGTCSIEKGIDVYVLRDLMGHSNVTTTQLYAKVMSTLKDREMQKWNTKKLPELLLTDAGQDADQAIDFSI
ncbi:MAG: site-specific integrase [Lentimicrobiaceae bacterium]|jgi:site-specific recombinase XerD